MDHSFDPGDEHPGAASAQRHAPRDAMFLHVELRRPGGEAGSTLRVRNLSPGGMMVETSAPFERGEAVIACLRNLGDVPARVAWIAEDRIGIAFDRSIDVRAARKAPIKSAGTTMMLTKPVARGRRPGLKIG